jgi:hypothetical protein
LSVSWRLRSPGTWGNLWYAIAGIPLLLVAGIAGFRWYAWTQTDLYQIERIEANALALREEIGSTGEFRRWLSALALTRNAAVACREADGFEDPLDRFAALMFITEALTKAEVWDEARVAAYQLWNSAHQLPPPGLYVRSLCALATTLREAGLADHAADLLVQAREDSLKLEPPQTRADSLCEVAVTHARAGQKREAQDLFAEAKAAAGEVKEPRPRAAALRKVDRIRRGIDSLDEALAATMKIEVGGARWMDLRDLSLKLLDAKRADLAKMAARGALDTAREQRWPLQLHGSILPWAVKVLPEVGLKHEVDKIVIDCQNFDLAIADPEQQALNLIRLAEALAVVGLKDSARQTAALARNGIAIKNPSSRAATLESLASAFARAGLTKDAIAVAVEINDPTRRAWAFRVILRALAKAGPTGDTTAIASKSRAAALEIENPFQRSQALGFLAADLAQAGLSDLAETTALEALEIRHRAEALGSIALHMARTGLHDRARALANQVEELVHQIQPIENRSGALNGVFHVLLVLGSLDEAHRVAGEITTPQQRSLAFAELAEAFAQRHQFREARLAAESCDIPQQRVSVFTNIVCEFTTMTRPQLSKALEKSGLTAMSSEERIRRIGRMP